MAPRPHHSPKRLCRPISNHAPRAPRPHHSPGRLCSHPPLAPSGSPLSICCLLGFLSRLHLPFFPGCAIIALL
jgi:hypothetical protein